MNITNNIDEKHSKKTICTRKNTKIHGKQIQNVRKHISFSNRQNIENSSEVV